MAMTEKEAAASLRVLVCVAKADGEIHVEETRALEAALEAAATPSHPSVAKLLAEEIDLEAELAVIGKEAADEVYRSAYAMASADGAASPAEEKMLELIRTKLGVSAEQRSLTERIFREAKDTLLLSSVKAISDPAERSKEIKEDTLKYSVLSALLGAFPVPGLAIATDLAVVALQVKLVRDIGVYWGHNVDKQGAKSLLYGLGLGTGARMAVSNLAKFVPGWGSAFGAAAAFASTFALGRVMDKFFSSHTAGDSLFKDKASALKDEFKAAEKEGKKAYADNKDAIASKESAAKAKLEALSEELKAGKIDQAEYERRAAELV